MFNPEILFFSEALSAYIINMVRNRLYLSAGDDDAFIIGQVIFIQ